MGLSLKKTPKPKLKLKQTKAEGKAQQLLDDYSGVMDNLIEFRKEHDGVFAEYDTLENKRDQLASDLRNEVRLQAGSVKNDGFKASFVPRKKRGWDGQKLLRLYPSALGFKGLVEVSINKEKMQEYLDLKEFPEKIAANAYFEEDLTPQVKIQAVK